MESRGLVAEKTNCTSRVSAGYKKEIQLLRERKAETNRARRHRGQSGTTFEPSAGRFIELPPTPQSTETKQRQTP